MSLGQKIRKLRKEKDISQEKLADILEVHITNISRYESNKQMPSADTIKKLAEFFEVSSDFLLFDNPKNISGETIRDMDLLQQFEKVAQMDEDDKKAIKIILDAMISKNEIKDIITKIK
ncbi:MAG: helix-turn-helix transcriptional regulator [bacterium]|nr:helix-turn-helix transcriptional regulator [bacterium]